jgi:hypothetical protein
MTHGGARGDGADDTVALQRTLDDPACSEIILPPGKVFSASVLHVRRSNVALTIAQNATLAGLPAKFRLERPDCSSEEPGLLTQVGPGDPRAPASGLWAPSLDSPKPTENSPETPDYMAPGTFGSASATTSGEVGLEFNWRQWCALLRVSSEANFSLGGSGTIWPGGKLALDFKVILTPPCIFH